VWPKLEMMANDLIVSEVIRRNDLQVWFVAEHIVNAPIVEAT
jgi:starvation-inducible DNA-binding protein